MKKRLNTHTHTHTGVSSAPTGLARAQAITLCAQNGRIYCNGEHPRPLLARKDDDGRARRELH